MSWTLSCLSLRRHYEDVVLYTDSVGKWLLIDVLHLPYTDVHIVFDDFPCLPHHWALAKIYTYSLQTKPFIHVDGDVYLSHALSEDILSAPLIAQNREIGTIYYRRMMDRIRSHAEIKLPDYIEFGLCKDCISSYNMGFWGGNDISFIHRYCKEVFRFMDDNRMNDSEYSHSRVDCNVFFEQIIFAMMANREHKEVVNVLGRDMRDNGYTRREICDLKHYSDHLFHHLLGGFKKDAEVLSSLELALLGMFPDQYLHILSLFPERHVRMRPKEDICKAEQSSDDNSLNQYKSFLLNCRKDWQSIPLSDLCTKGRKTAMCVRFEDATEEERGGLMISINPYVRLYNLPSPIRPEFESFVRTRIGHEDSYPLCSIAVIPILQLHGVKELQIQRMDEDILNSISMGKTSYKEIEARFLRKYTFSNEREFNGARRHLSYIVDRLLRNGLIFVV